VEPIDVSGRRTKLPQIDGWSGGHIIPCWVFSKPIKTFFPFSRPIDPPFILNYPFYYRLTFISVFFSLPLYLHTHPPQTAVTSNEETGRQFCGAHFLTDSLAHFFSPCKVFSNQQANRQRWPKGKQTSIEMS
jgi:hypothetical protein